MLYQFKVGYKTFLILEYADLEIDANKDCDHSDYLAVLSTGGPTVMSNHVHTGNVLGLCGRLWYIFLKELMSEITYPDYLAEKLGLDEEHAKQFIREFNDFLQEYQNEKTQISK